jgi:hypothetical protein
MKSNEESISSMTEEEIKQKIEQLLVINDSNKNKLGEVFTPPQIIDNLLDELPKSIWSNPNIRILDPANGIGNILMLVYLRFMKGLEKWELNKTKRSFHIIKNILFMTEINPKNIAISKKIFGKNANICKCDFLNDSQRLACFEKFGINTFNIILGNPPFQKEKITSDFRQGSHRSPILWDKFIKTSLGALKEKGFLCFITPSGWRKPENELYNLMTKQNHLKFLRIYGETESRHLLKVAQRVDSYIIIKDFQTNKKTKIIDEMGKTWNFDISRWQFLPNYEYNIIKKLITSDKEKGIRVIYSSIDYDTRQPYMRNKKKDSQGFIHPVIHSMNSDGIEYWYSKSKEREGMFGVPKIILSLGRYQYPINDSDGKYAMSQIAFGLPTHTKKEGEEMLRAIQSEKFAEIIKATKWGAFQTEWKMFQYFKPDFYKYFLRNSNKTEKMKKSNKNKTMKKK